MNEFTPLGDQLKDLTYIHFRFAMNPERPATASGLFVSRKEEEKTVFLNNFFNWKFKLYLYKNRVVV